jgi:glyceraldehyde-3-phosphate dehydrogenase/erythrose-4-phosphate dehydrogenase
MPPANQSGNQNQTLLELIYAMKSLAQQVEFYHQDLSRRLDEEVRARQRDLSRVLEMSGKNAQTLTVLPITLSDRVEKLLERLEQEMEGKLEGVTRAIDDVRRTLHEYTRTTDRAISQNEMTAAVEKAREDGQDITGRIELTDKGDIRVRLNSAILKKIWYGVVVIATGGGAYGFVELVKKLVKALSE